MGGVRLLASLGAALAVSSILAACGHGPRRSDAGTGGDAGLAGEDGGLLADAAMDATGEDGGGAATDAGGDAGAEAGRPDAGGCRRLWFVEEAATARAEVFGGELVLRATDLGPGCDPASPPDPACGHDVWVFQRGLTGDFRMHLDVTALTGPAPGTMVGLFIQSEDEPHRMIVATYGSLPEPVDELPAGSRHFCGYERLGDGFRGHGCISGTGEPPFPVSIELARSGSTFTMSAAGSRRTVTSPWAGPTIQFRVYIALGSFASAPIPGETTLRVDAFRIEEGSSVESDHFLCDSLIR